MRLTEPFYRRKIAQCQAVLAARDLAGLLLFKPANIYHMTGFFHYPTERMVAVWLPASGEPVLFIPKLEEDHAAEGWMRQVEVYFEHLGPPHPLEWLADRLKAWGLSHTRLGYEGSLAEGTLRCLQTALPHARWSADGGAIITDLRLIKDAEELDLLRAAGRYADYMVEVGAQTVRERGLLSELEINQIVNQAVVQRMTAELDQIVFISGVAGGLVCAGPRAAYPHGLPSLARPRQGDALILSFGCAVGGYHAESERTFFIGEPSADHLRYYDAMQRAQAAGTAALRAGATCREVNWLCLDVLREAGYGEFIKHRMGHGLGLEGHEPPWIEDGDATVLQAGMVVSSEPGLYVPGVGGYRISDTVFVTANGPELLTTYARDLDAMVLTPAASTVRPHGS
jgi:Xaa-Pro aminopeptidase